MAQPTYQLKEVKTWTEPEQSGWRPGTLRVYVGSVHVGWAEPTRSTEELYRFKSCLDGEILNVTASTRLTLEDIKMQVEMSLKEFLKKIIKSVKQPS